MKKNTRYALLGVLTLAALGLLMWHPIAGGVGLAVAGVYAWVVGL